MNIQWYPGHMTKARRAMKEDLKLVDLIIELVDARVPYSSRNPDIDELGRQKARLILLNKADLASETANAAWITWFRNQGFQAVKVDSRNKGSLKQIQPAVQEACKEKIERDRKRGLLNRPVRAMVVGIPNVGKSTFINSYAGKACAKTGNKPGVTKGNQWIRLNKSLELLDTPGILWPRFESREVGIHLALIGSINDEILNREELAAELITFLLEHDSQALSKRYGEDLEKFTCAGGIQEPDRASFLKTPEEVCSAGPESGFLDILGEIARVRGCLVKGSGYDYKKAAHLLLEDYRSGRLGRITLEMPPDSQDISNAALSVPGERKKGEGIWQSNH